MSMYSILSKLQSYRKAGNAGFTLIELLIVIAILGILAVAVLSAINPVEQINRGRDTGSRSDSEQVLSAIDRFNAFQGYYPWQTGVTDTAGLTAINTLTLFDATVTDSADCPVWEKLSSLAAGSPCTLEGTDELKVTFFDRIFNTTSSNQLYIYNNGTQGDSTYVCFVPRSQAFLTEAQTRCQDDAGLGLPDDIVGGTRATICDPDPQIGELPGQMICLP